MINIPTVGTAAKFEFVVGFSTLDGIYKLTNIMSFETMLEDGINLVDALYIPAGLTKTEYDAAWTNYQGGKVLKLQRLVGTSDVIYVPEALLKNVPDPQITKCHNFYIAIELGVFDDPDKVSYMLDQLSDIAASVSGTQETAQLFSSSEEWMTSSDYQSIEDERAARITGLDLQSVSITELLAEVARLQTLVDGYEATLVALQAP